jgi:hypothetical protein
MPNAAHKPRLLEIVRRVPGLEGARAADALLDLGRGRKVAVEFRGRVRTPEAWAAIERARQSKRPLVVVAEEATEGARSLLDEHGVGVIDAAGNVRLNLTELIVHIDAPKGRRRRREGAGRRLAGRAGVVVQALLLNLGREWNVAALANTAGVSRSLVHYVLTRLEDLEIVESQGSGPKKIRRLLKPAALLDLWVEEATDHGVRRLACYRFVQQPEKLLDQLSTALQDQGVRHAASGTAAANRLAPFLTSVPFVGIWVAAEHLLEDVVRLIDAEPTERGANVMLMRARDDTPLAFSGRIDGVELANVFRVYLDARRDPQRGAEQAEHLRSEVIGF